MPVLVSGRTRAQARSLSGQIATKISVEINCLGLMTLGLVPFVAHYLVKLAWQPIRLLSCHHTSRVVLNLFLSVSNGWIFLAVIGPPLKETCMLSSSILKSSSFSGGNLGFRPRLSLLMKSFRVKFNTSIYLWRQRFFSGQNHLRNLCLRVGRIENDVKPVI